MTSPFGDLPSQPDKRPGQDDPDSGEETGSKDRFTETDLWSDESKPEVAQSRFADEPGAPTTASPNGSAWSRELSEAWQGDASLAPGGRGAADPYDEFEASAAYDQMEQGERKQGAAGRVRRVGWELVQTLLLALLIFLLVRGVAQNFRVEGPSMEPGLHNGQYLLVNKAVYFKLNLDELGKYIPFLDGGDDPSRYLFHGPERGDVIVFRFPNDPDRDFIKRVIGVPGDTVEITEGMVRVNGVELIEEYINPGSSSDLEPRVVPESSYFVMGDNRPNSSDSRSWGFVPEENIIGKAMFSYWPLSELGGIGNTSIDLGVIKIPLP